MQRMAFHARADATREAVEHILVFVPHAPPNRNHVAGPAIFRVDGAEYVVEQRPLLEFRVLDVRL